MNAVDKYLASCTLKERAVFHLVYDHQFTIQQIAEVHDLSFEDAGVIVSNVLVEFSATIGDHLRSLNIDPVLIMKPLKRLYDIS